MGEDTADDVERFAGITDEELSGPKVDRRTTMTLLFAGGMTGLAGCTGGDKKKQAAGGDSTDTSGGSSDSGGDSTPTESPKIGGRLSAGWFLGEANQLDPHLSNLGFEGQISDNIFNSLVTTTKNLEIKGDFAKDWKVENDAKRMTFTLREGVKVHKDYGELTAEDVQYTAWRGVNLKGSLASSTFTPLKEPIKGTGVKVIDDYTVELNFKSPFVPGLLQIGQASIIPKAAAEDMSRDKYNQKPVGAGPFEVTGHEPGQSITLDAFDDFYKTDENGVQLPYLDGVDISPIPEAATLVNALKSGQIQFANSIPAQNASTVEKSQGVQLARPPAAGWTGVQINCKRDPLTDPKNRLALAKTIDKKEFIQQAFFGAAEPALGPIAPVHSKYYRENKPDYQAYAPEEAKKMLEETGAINAPLTIITTKRDVRAARAMKDQLNDVFDVDVQPLPSSTFWDRENEDYDIAVTGAAPDTSVDGPLYYFFRPKDSDPRTDVGGGTFNDMWYIDQEVNKLLAKQRTIADPEKRAKVLHKAEDKIMKEAPVAFTHHGIPFQATGPKVKGYVPHISYRDFSTVWLKE